MVQCNTILHTALQPGKIVGSIVLLDSVENIKYLDSLHWRHNRHDSVSNHQPHDCLLHRLFRRRSTKISKLRVTGICAGNLPETGEFPTQRASNAENVSIWWRHHILALCGGIQSECLSQKPVKQKGRPCYDIIMDLNMCECWCFVLSSVFHNNI